MTRFTRFAVWMTTNPLRYIIWCAGSAAICWYSGVLVAKLVNP